MHSLYHPDVGVRGLRLVGIALWAMGCGDDAGSLPDADTSHRADAAIDAPMADAPALDAPPPDAPVDAPVDAPPFDAAMIDGGDPNAPPRLACTSDNLARVSSGTMTTGPAEDLIPLCDGLVVLGDRGTSRIVMLDVGLGTERASYPLTAAPGDLELDPGNDVVYATLDGTAALARIDLRTGAQSTIALPTPAHGIAWSGNATLLAITDDTSSNSLRRVSFVDGNTQTVVRTLDASGSFFADMVVYERSVNQLVMGTAALSPGNLYRYTVSTSALALTESFTDQGGNCLDLRLSSDENHLVYICGSGNGGGSYTILDRDPQMLTMTQGTWTIGPYPISADFRPDVQRLAVTDTTSIQMWTMTSPVREVNVSINNCPPYGRLDRVRFSRGGNIIYAFGNCGFSHDSGGLYWVTVP